MIEVTVVFKGGEQVTFPAKDIELKTSTSEENYGQLVEYSVDALANELRPLFLDIHSIAGVFIQSDGTEEVPESADAD